VTILSDGVGELEPTRETSHRSIETDLTGAISKTSPVSAAEHDRPECATSTQQNPGEFLERSAPEQALRSVTTRTADDLWSVVGSAVGSLGLVWVLYEQILPFSGVPGFIVCWWIGYLALYTSVSMMSQPRPIVIDRLASAIVASGAAVIGIALASTVIYTFARGWPALHHLNFFTHDMGGVSPGTDPLTKGGITHALVGSAIQVGLATIISLPLGVVTAVYLTEVGGRLATVVRTVVEAMTALPDILAGLFVYVLLILLLGFEKSGFAVSLALAVTMIPVIARSAEVVLRLVPSGLREASLALGAPRWRTTWRVVLPTARAGLATSLILGIARVTGETAPLLIVSGASTFFNTNPFKDPMTSLPLFVYSGVKSGQPLFISRSYGAAAVLLTVVLMLFITTRFLARDRARK
jgi:phosphate transport system permease protein